jgi:hypothetical protein
MAGLPRQLLLLLLLVPPGAPAISNIQECVQCMDRATLGMCSPLVAAGGNCSALKVNKRKNLGILDSLFSLKRLLVSHKSISIVRSDLLQPCAAPAG